MSVSTRDKARIEVAFWLAFAVSVLVLEPAPQWQIAEASVALAGFRWWRGP